MNIKNVVLFFILLYSKLLSQGFVDGGTIRSITFSPLPKRTKIETLKDIIYPIKEGKRYYRKTKNEIIEKLHAEGIFTPDIVVMETFDNEYVDLTITVVDKWTLIGAPMFSFSSTSWFAGAGVFEMNAFGRNKKIFFVGRYGNRGWYVNMMYTDPRFFIDRLSSDISLYVGEDYTKDYDVKNKEFVRDYNNLYGKAILNFGFNVVDDVKLILGLKYEINDLIKNTLSKVNKMQHVGINYGFVWQNTKYSYPFIKGFKIKFDGSYNVAVSKGSTNYFIGKTEVNAAFIFAKRNRVGFLLSAGLSDASAQREFRLGGFESTYVLPNAIVSANRYNSLFVFYEIFMFDIKWKKKSIVAFTLQPFYEVGVFKSTLVSQTLYHGPGVGLLIYPSVISGTTPSIGFRVGWDLENKDFNFIFSGSRSL